MKRTYAAAIVIVVIAMCLFCLAACGNNTETPQNRETPKESPQTAPEPAAESAHESTPAPKPKPATESSPSNEPTPAAESSPSTEPSPEPIEDDTLKGFYTLIKYDVEGTDIMGLAEDSGESTLFIYIGFRNDGTALFFFMDEGEDVTYKVSGNQVTLIFEVDDGDNELEGIIEGDSITFERDGLVMVYKHNPDFEPDETR